MHDDFRRALEEIKLRAPVEDVVREYVPTLRKSGPLWVACCPFHDEKTASFKVDPRRGTWHCFGACSEGGDQIRFVERFCGVAFLEAAEILAARAGVELPRRRGMGREEGEHTSALDALERATRFYEEVLRSPAGNAAREYLAQRGLEPETVRTFRLGFASSDGRALVEHARRSSIPYEALEQAGLARRNDRGHPYDFFRGRLVFPIRDLEGRVVGFGARRLGDEVGGPKYVNTPETPLFHKNRLIYGLDRAIAESRRTGRLVLVEGYTDVMAAHQAGLSNVVAVLGTSTTNAHTGLVRRAGARRVSLVFDGDDAGRKAADRALLGLLPLEIELEVVELPAGVDPCDLLARGQRDEFVGRLERASGWFDYACSSLQGLRGADLSREIDRILELLARLKKPVHREALLTELAARSRISIESLREQARRPLPARRPGPAVEPRGVPSRPRRDPPPAHGRSAELSRKAYEGLARAVLLDDSLVPVVRPYVASCPDPDLKRILEVILELYEDEESVIDAKRVMTLLEEHPARRLVSGLVESPEGLESPKSLLEGELSFLRRRECELRKDELTRRILDLQLAIDQATSDPLDEAGHPSTAAGPSREAAAGGEDLAAARRELQRLRSEYAALMEPARSAFVQPTQSGFVQPTQSGFVQPTQSGFVQPTQNGFVQPTRNGGESHGSPLSHSARSE